MVTPTATWMLSILLMAAGPDTAVVCSSNHRPALDSWVAYRQAQGHRIVWIEPDIDPRVVRSRLRQAGRRVPLRYVLIVGDHRGPIAVPTFHVAAKVNVAYGSEATIATDAPYGDLDGDGLPELAVGRWSVESGEQLAWQIEKVRIFERQRGNWRRQMHVVAGAGGFGPVIDGAIEMGAKRILARGIPDDYHVTLTRASWRSPFCPDPSHFRDCVLDRMNEGGLFWVYMGHGSWQELDWLKVPGKRYPIMQRADAARLQYQVAPSIAVFLACYTGAVDADDSLAELFVRARGGPVAAIAASRVSMPFGMTVFGTGLMDGYFERHQATLGDIYWFAQQRLLAPQLPSRDRWLGWLAKSVSPQPALLDAERREHVWLFNLLGDPLLRLPHPHPAVIEVADRAAPDQQLTVSIEVPFGGTGVLSLLGPPRTPRLQLPPRREFATTEGNRFTREYRLANDPVWHRQPVQVESVGRCRIRQTLRVPTEASGPCRVSLYLEDAHGRYTLASKTVHVAAPSPQAEGATVQSP